MSWLISRALMEDYANLPCSLGQVGAFSEASCSDGAPSAPSSGNPTPQAYLPPDRMMAFSRPSRFGMTFAPLTDDHGAAVLTSFLAAFPARTSASQAKAPALTESAAACGPTWRASLARFDLATSSWKTAQRSLLGDLDESSVIWPRSGMTADGQCWELSALERRTKETGSGLWPTPTAALHWSGGSDCAGKRRPENLASAVKTWPTPTSSLGTNGGKVTPTKAREGGTLIEALSARTTWPTPTVCGNYNRKGASATSGDGLATAVLKCATPTSRDWRSGKASQATMERNSRPLSEQIGGSLNPTWVEWLMGWPLGWTDLKPLATDRFRSVLQQRGKC